MRRSICLGAGAAVAVLFQPSSAGADHCHRPPPESDTERPFHVEARAVFASLDAGGVRGGYEGLGPGIGWSSGRFSAEASLLFYRLLRNGAVELGPGDALLAVDFALLESEGFRLGVEAAATLPTGDADAELGMGHLMAMPNLWASLALGSTRLSARAGYGAAIAADGEHDAHGGARDHAHHRQAPAEPAPRPLVSPMNSEELEAALFLSQVVLEGASFELGGDVAIPTSEGRERAVVSLGAAWEAGAFASRAQIELPLAGDPFTLRTSIALGFSW